MSILKPILATTLFMALGVGGYFGYLLIKTPKPNTEESAAILSEEFVKEAKLEWVSGLVGDSQNIGIRQSIRCAGKNSVVRISAAESPFYTGHALVGQRAEVVYNQNEITSSRAVFKDRPQKEFSLEAPSVPIDCNGLVSKWPESILALGESLKSEVSSKTLAQNLTIGNVTIPVKVFNHEKANVTQGWRYEGEFNSIEKATDTFLAIKSAIEAAKLGVPFSDNYYYSSPLAPKKQSSRELIWSSPDLMLAIRLDTDELNQTTPAKIKVEIKKIQRPHRVQPGEKMLTK